MSELARNACVLMCITFTERRMREITVRISEGHRTPNSDCIVRIVLGLRGGGGLTFVFLV